MNISVFLMDSVGVAEGLCSKATRRGAYDV